ncbi:MAG: endonuclease/exonuclease/phosphatase family protein [Actinomycetota bacterium]|nr:endonuclease/exonuclease/phosphatase family protein [Actinomycetota bacterium]
MLAHATSRRARTLFASLFTLAGLLLLPAGQAQADHEYKLFQFNMAGNTIHTGNDTTDDSNDPVMSLKASLTGDADRPVAASINEMCRNQFLALLAELREAEPAKGWDGEFATFKHGDPHASDPDLCEQGGEEHDYGMALLSHEMVAGSAQRWSLSYTSDGGETRKLMCITLSLAKNVKACNTHIAHLNSWTPDTDTCLDHSKQNTQIREVADTVNNMVNDQEEVILMGDFNREPTAGGGDEDCNYSKMDHLYHDTIFGGRAHGKFEEVGQWDPNSTYDFIPRCRCGGLTFEYENDGALTRRIDFIFANADDWTLENAEATGVTAAPAPDKAGRVSDHKIVRGRVRIVH